VLAWRNGAEVGALDIMSNRSYTPGDMPARRDNSFEDFYGELEAEARAEGPEAVRDLRAKEIKYALINTLISRRRDLNLTQQTLAEHAGVAQTEISKIERGRKSPTLDTFSRIAGALRLTFSARNAPQNVRATRRIGAGATLAWRVDEKDSAALVASKAAPRRRMPAGAMATSRRTTRAVSRSSTKKKTSVAKRQSTKRTTA